MDLIFAVSVWLRKCTIRKFLAQWYQTIVLAAYYRQHIDFMQDLLNGELMAVSCWLYPSSKLHPQVCHACGADTTNATQCRMYHTFKSFLIDRLWDKLPPSKLNSPLSLRHELSCWVVYQPSSSARDGERERERGGERSWVWRGELTHSLSIKKRFSSTLLTGKIFPLLFKNVLCITSWTSSDSGTYWRYQTWHHHTSLGVDASVHSARWRSEPQVTDLQSLRCYHTHIPCAFELRQRARIWSLLCRAPRCSGPMNW